MQCTTKRDRRTTVAAALWRAAATAAFAAAAVPSPAQVPATNDVAACTLLADPTAQRTCLESARQRRPAAAFDPSATRPRMGRGRAQDGDATGLARSADGRRTPRRRGADAPSPATGAPSDAPTQIP